MIRSRRGPMLAIAALATGACAGAQRGGAAAVPSGLHAPVPPLGADPTVLGPRLVPDVVDEGKTYGVEPGGGLRAIAAGVRVVSLPNGVVAASADRLPASPSSITPLPERLGGGFLFVEGSIVWRSDRWLGPARPIYTSQLGIGRLYVGLDRVILRSPSGAHQAIDAVTGAPMDLGAWPAAPFVGAYVAADGWRAVAIDDLRGAVATFDAGATWRALPLPIEPREVERIGDAIAIGGPDAQHATAWYEVREAGQIGRLATSPSAMAGEAGEAGEAKQAEHAAIDPAAKAFGRRPLRAAVEDGWPLGDGTALVARDGALGRVRLDDGALVEVVPAAFPLRPSRCHPVPMGRPQAPGAFGFVCGEARGATVLYAFDAARGALVPRRRFDTPRVVLAAGSGAIAVRGSCAPAGDDDAAVHAYCILGRDDAWREIHVRGDIGGERVIALADGRVAVVSPPSPTPADVTSARITIVDGGKTTSAPLAFAPLGADVSRILRVGVWMDGFEERRPGVVGGWIEAGGSMLGIEIAATGEARIGELVRDAGAPMVAGRYGLGWTASRRGYETTDGGMSWIPIEVPEPIAPPRMVGARACGPVGCTAAGWLRIGWGPSRTPPPPDPPPPGRLPPIRPSGALTLECEPTGSLAMTASPPAVAAPPHAPRPPHLPLPFPRPLAPGPFPTPLRALDFAPFYGQDGPAPRPDDRGLSYESNELLDRYVRLGPVARVYAWGPRSGEWEHQSGWLVRWLSPFGGPTEVRSTLPAVAPSLLVDVARAATSNAMATMPPTWSIAPGDDGAHALLVVRRSARTDASVFELDADRAPVEARRADGDPFTEIDAAIRAGGRWYLATPAAPGEAPAAVVWQLDGPQAHEIARLPRVGMETRPTPPRLARRDDDRAIGLVVEGQPVEGRIGPTRWVAAIDLESGTVADPELLGPSDLADRGAVGACGAEAGGWTIDLPTTLPITVASAGKPLGAIHSAVVRARLWADGACIEGIAGTLDAFGADTRALESDKAPAPAAHGPSISTSVVVARTRRTFRCVRR